ncbi:MAG: NUDIX domain-containing protein [Anaerolineae bacterium]|nr:NUDIX domain-containing protein [Anaerolineae bacterium]
MSNTTLRLGVMTAVTDRRGHLLLSRRADLGIWTLPGGRLDSGEWIDHAAAREVEEETGVEAAVTHPVGLYYLDGWRRMNVVFAAAANGGVLCERTDETRGNAFFAPGKLPDAPRMEVAREAISARRPQPRIIETPPGEQRHMRLTFARRYVWNWLRGRPEPKYPVFDVRATALIWDESHRRVLTVKNGNGRTLPRVRCDGTRAPWIQLAKTVRDTCGIAVDLHWVGVWQDAPRNKLEFVFAATVNAKTIFRAGEWTLARGAGLPDYDMRYIVQTKASYAQDAVWLLRQDAAVRAGDVLAR